MAAYISNIFDACMSHSSGEDFDTLQIFCVFYFKL